MSLVIETMNMRQPAEVTLPAAVLERLRTRANNLKMLPAIATQALEIVKDPDCGVNEFAAVVERDPSLAAGILRMANSLLFSGGKPVLNLHQGVVRLGFRQCKNLIVTASFSSMMKSLSLEEEWVRETLAQHSFTTALLCLHLNRSLDLGFQGEEFVGGLIHDIGRMLLATCYSERFREIDRLEFDDEVDILSSEQAVIESDHCRVGTWFAKKNALPEELLSVILHHHHPVDANDNHRSFVALVAVGDHMANHLQRHDESRGYDPRGNPAIQVLEDCGFPHLMTRFADIAAPLMDTAKRDADELLAI